MPYGAMQQISTVEQLRNFRRLPDRIIYFGIKSHIVKWIPRGLKHYFSNLRFREGRIISRSCTAGADTKRCTGFCIMIMLLMVISN